MGGGDHLPLGDLSISFKKKQTNEKTIIRNEEHRYLK